MCIVGPWLDGACRLGDGYSRFEFTKQIIVNIKQLLADTANYYHIR